MSTIKANDIQNASGGIPTVKGQRLIPTAWVNFNGITNAVRDSENVSSITDNSTGYYTINLSSPMLNGGYSVVPSASLVATGTGGSSDNDCSARSLSTTSFSISCYREGASAFFDPELVTAVAIGGQA